MFLSKLEWLVLALALFLVPGSPWGAETPQQLFDRLDRDKDGYLSAQELASDAAKGANWIAVDRDRDGRISRAEFGTTIAQPSPSQAPSAAAGATKPPKPE
jgi:Ca2+-binding EF-hand superfamily protein